MLIGGAEKLERMRDGRAVYVGSEKIDDVTTHPAFAEGARTVAALYDWKADPSRREALTYVDPDDGPAGDPCNLYWLRPRTHEELTRRMRAMKALADFSYGLIGRTPDQVATLIAGIATDIGVLNDVHAGFGDNLLAYYHQARRADLYLSFAAVPPAGLRATDIFPGAEQDVPSLRVIDEDDSGVIMSGIKILATSAIYADELWIGNLAPLDAKYSKESITCAVPLNAPGLALWSRRPYGAVAHEADYPLSYRYDETDAVLVCDQVHVPWERVFLHDNGAMARQIYLDTPGMCFANHHSTVRFWSKMGLIVGLASRICQAHGIAEIPSVRETLGRFAAQEGMIGAMVSGQVEGWEAWPEGFASPSRRFMYASVLWCQENHSAIIDDLRTLLGGIPLQMPASIDVVDDPALKDLFQRWWKVPSMEAVERLKLYKLAWDLVGSEFAGRHQLYEKFYAGNLVNMRNHNFREAPWATFHGLVDAMLANVGEG